MWGLKERKKTLELYDGTRYTEGVEGGSVYEFDADYTRN